MTTARKAAVLGHPIAHSLSPVLHRAAYRALGLTDWTYTAIDTTAEQLPDRLKTLDDTWAGLSLTMPLKTAVIPLLDHIEPQAEAIGVVNTVLVTGPGSRPVLVGANTDIAGIVTAIGESEQTLTSAAAVIGGGATAASALVALTQLGCDRLDVYAREPSRTGALQRSAYRMGISPHVYRIDSIHRRRADYQAVICTLPAGAADPLVDQLASWVRPAETVLLDVVYSPWPTPLARAWQAAGGQVVGGDVMLLHQAAEQVRLMTGLDAPLADMRAALSLAIGG